MPNLPKPISVNLQDFIWSKKWWGRDGGGPMKQEEENMNKKDMVWRQLSLKADH